MVIVLRVQKERLSENEHIDSNMYIKDFKVTTALLKYAKKDVMVMHPGPMNRGIEIDTEVADGPHSFILRQVENGVYMRMAIFEFLLGNTHV